MAACTIINIIIFIKLKLQFLRTFRPVGCSKNPVQSSDSTRQEPNNGTLMFVMETTPTLLLLTL